MLVQLCLECGIIDVPFDDQIPRLLVDCAICADLPIKRRSYSEAGKGRHVRDNKTDLDSDGWIPVDPLGRYLSDKIDVFALQVGRHGEVALSRNAS